MIILRLLYCILLFFVFDFFCVFIGYLVFYFGKFIKCLPLMRAGHSFVSSHIVSFFGLHKKWIYKNCSFRFCNDCPYFTCSGFRKHIKSKD